MNLSLLIILIWTVVKTASNPIESNTIDQNLIEIIEKLNKLELQLNQSVQHLLTRIDSSSENIVRILETNGPSSKNENISAESMAASTQPVSALLIIDVQNDFINGSLALRNCPSKHNGEEVVPVINQLLDTIKFDVVVYSFDWHPADHISFLDNLPLRAHFLTNDSVPLENLNIYSTATFALNGLPRMEQILWPRHCVQDTTGAQLHPDLKYIEEKPDSPPTVIRINKGTKSDIDSYSAFWDNFKLSETKLNEKLQEKQVKQVFVAGLATDWCVYSTAVHALEYGYTAFIIDDASRGVDETHIKERLADFTAKNGSVIHSSQVNKYVAMKDIQ